MCDSEIELFLIFLNYFQSGVYIRGMDGVLEDRVKL